MDVWKSINFFLSLTKIIKKINFIYLLIYHYRVTMPSYGVEFRDFLRGSEFESFRTLGAMLDVGTSVTQGLNQALKYRSVKG